MVDRKFGVTKSEALSLYSKMVLTRMTEAKHDELFQKQVLPVYTHLSLGQEVVGCAAGHFLGKDDFLIGTHRGVAEYIGKGMSVTDIFLEYGGRANSISGGRAGLHLHSPALNILPLTGSLGTDFSLAVGVGYSIRRKGLKRVVVDYFGEGAAEQVDFLPAMNMAVLWNVPAVYLCCTNQFVEWHPYRDTTSTKDVAPRAGACGMSFKIVQDGNDLFAVGSAMKEAIAHCRSGKGPYFLEVKTYRLAPHQTGDQCAYREKADVECAWKNDPLPKSEKALKQRKWADKAFFKKTAEKCTQDIDKAVEILLSSELPDSATILDLAMTL